MRSKSSTLMILCLGLGLGIRLLGLRLRARTSADIYRQHQTGTNSFEYGTDLTAEERAHTHQVKARVFLATDCLNLGRDRMLQTSRRG